MEVINQSFLGDRRDTGRGLPEYRNRRVPGRQLKYHLRSRSDVRSKLITYISSTNFAFSPALTTIFNSPLVVGSYPNGKHITTGAM